MTVDMAVFSHAWWCLCLKIEPYFTELFTRGNSYSDVTSQGHVDAEAGVDGEVRSLLVYTRPCREGARPDHTTQIGTKGKRCGL